MLTQQIRYLRAHGYHTITLARLARRIRYGNPLPSNPVALTFDDGYRDQFTKALPVLKRYHMKATFFIVSGFVDEPLYMTWRQVRGLHRAGMEIGVHTIHHLDLAILSPGQDWQEIHRSKVVIERHIGHPALVFAYPSGAFNAQVLADVHKSGYLAAVSTLPGTLDAQAGLYSLFRGEMPGPRRVTALEVALGSWWGDPFEPTPTVP